MNDKNLDKIINESITMILNENFYGDLGALFKDYFSKREKDKKQDKKSKKEFKLKKKKKIRKKKNGREELYDYDDYQIKNKKISAGDATSIINTIDTEKTNIAAVARELFPDHTEEGAQSQLRKILNGERPMTKKIASKLEKMISAGKIAVK